MEDFCPESPRSRRSTATLAALAFALVASWAHADQVNLSASHDNTLYQDLNGALSNGAGEFFFAGNSGGATPSRRGLIAFDLSAFPINATINSVTLTLQMK